MKIIKLISVLLTVLMLTSAFSVIVGAAGSEEETGPKYSTLTGNGNSLMTPVKGNDGSITYKYKEGKYIDANKVERVVSSPEEKLALMDFRYSANGYELYIDAYSGEVAIKSVKTGDTLFTNPYNIGHSTASDESDSSTKNELMSQLIINYTRISDDNKGRLNSYKMSAEREQIIVKNIQGGLRVEYTIGQDETRSLLPRLIEASAYEAIFSTMKANLDQKIAEGAYVGTDAANRRHDLSQFDSYYQKYSLKDCYTADGTFLPEVYALYIQLFPILQEFEEKAKTDPQYEDFAIYSLKDDVSGVLTKKLEGLIKEFHPEYTYEQLDADHAYVKYVPKTEEYPLFKMALEYTIEDTGLVVRLPANGIRFDETLYRLDYIEVLPYMGAGTNPNTGYTFFPDGSGTLFDFEDIAISNKTRKESGKIYGQDYAYHKISGMYEEVIRYPVFGLYEELTLTKDVEKDGGEIVKETYKRDRGFVAMIEEGESLMELSTYHGGRACEYNTVIMSVYPRPTDSYNMADALSVGGTNKEWTVVSSRKYTGSFTVRYMMLTDDEVAKEKGIEDYYETSYVGMALAYRDYLVKNGMLTRLTSKDVKDDIPLYIETFGALETTKRVLSIPITVMTPLTSFGDIQKMYKDLKTSEITNVNFIMTGYTDGGMTGEKIPYNLKWESAVKKEMDFDELTEYARGEGFGLFPDFDFVFASNNTLFDGLTLNKHAAKTIDDRYTSKREYSATKHTYVSFFDLVISAAYYDHFYEKFIPKYNKTSPIGISVSSLGSYLNSDFDEDEPYNRADAQKYTVDAFEYINENITEGTQIMTSGGNAYSWKFVDHITDVALDSSRYSISSATVPFLGIVLHGYVQFAGEAANMEGNLDYAFLKSLESGAALKFILSYRNTAELKEYETLSKYYSVKYDIWYDKGYGDLVTMYKELNGLLRDVQTSVIVGHEFVDGVRVPDNDEIMADAAQAIKDAIAYENALANATSDAERQAIYDARQLILKGSELIKNAVSTTEIDSLINKLGEIKKIVDGNSEFDALIEDAEQALEEFKAYQRFHAIYSDYTSTPSYKVEDALKAYDAYKADPTNTELKAAYDEKVKFIGQTYMDAVLAERAAKVALDADAENETLKAAYEAAVEARKALIAGNAPDIADLVAAMNNAEIQALMDAYLAAKAGTDKAAGMAALLALEEKVKEVYSPYYSADIAYRISYEGDKNYVGGSQIYRNHYADVYAAKIKDLTVALEAVYADITTALDEADAIANVYSYAQMVEALALINAKEAYTEDERLKLTAMVNEINDLISVGAGKTAYDSIIAFVGSTEAADAAYEKYVALKEASDKADDAITDGKKPDGSDGDPLADYEIATGTMAPALGSFTATEFTWATKIVEEEKTEIKKPTANTERYESDDNMIVHVTYDNGKEFLLNFNDYRVSAVVNGTTYTIDALGYVVIKKANS